MLSVLLVIVFAFAVGGIPFGYLTGRLVLKDDIRRFGSGNTGATNVARTLGWKWGLIVLLLDAGKGIAAVWVASPPGPLFPVTDSAPLLRVLAGVFAIVGHMYPIWLKLRGGKGVATALGVIVMLSPPGTLTATVAFAVSFAVSRVVSLSSMISATAFAVGHFATAKKAPLDATQLPLTVFAILIPSMIIWKHRTNIQRLLNGTEKKFRSAATGCQDSASEETPVDDT